MKRQSKGRSSKRGKRATEREINQERGHPKGTIKGEIGQCKKRGVIKGAINERRRCTKKDDQRGKVATQGGIGQSKEQRGVQRGNQKGLGDNSKKQPKEESTGKGAAK